MSFHAFSDHITSTSVPISELTAVERTRVLLLVVCFLSFVRSCILCGSNPSIVVTTVFAHECHHCFVGRVGSCRVGSCRVVSCRVVFLSPGEETKRNETNECGCVLPQGRVDSCLVSLAPPRSRSVAAGVRWVHGVAVPKNSVPRVERAGLLPASRRDPVSGREQIQSLWH